MEKIDPLYPKNVNIQAKNRPFFQNRGHANFTKKDPFSGPATHVVKGYASSFEFSRRKGPFDSNLP